MKKLALTLACAFAATTVFAADEVVSSKTTTTTTTSSGTITEYQPGTQVVIKESTGPVTYRMGEKVTYVTKGGKTLTDAQVKTRLKAGVPVSVHYATEGEARLVNRIVLDDVEIDD